MAAFIPPTFRAALFRACSQLLPPKGGAWAVIFLLTSLPAFAASSEAVRLEQSQASLISSVESIKPGEEFLLGADIILDTHWHTYTYDPGDAGIPFNITWDLPEGLEIGEIHWPPHEQFNEAGLTTYGFSNQVVFTFKAKTSEAIADNTTIKAKAEYLICKDICIPQTAELTLTLPKGDSKPSFYHDTLNAWLEQSKLAEEWEDIKKNEPQTNIAPQQPTTNNQQPLIIYLLFALIGGLILNLMPCVFPVLSLKALAIAKHAEGHAKEVRKEGIAYTLGVLSCFWLLALLLITLQQAGTAIGWGFQFQSPGFVALMALLLFAIGLNLSGIFELPVLFGELATKLGREDSPRNSYFTGLLAALVATPCTAPFMATAIGFALTQPAATTLLIFTALGIGLALPFILIGYFPRLLKLLPKPGAWMDTFKKFLAFPMYLSAVWLVWVLGTQTGAEGIIVTLFITVFLLFFIWVASRCRMKSHFCTAANLFIILALLATLVEVVGKFKPDADAYPPVDKEGIAYSAEKLAELRAAGTPVFVDATASWCITCKVNYRLAINRDEVQQAFKEKGIVYMVADWTNKNAEISAFLSSHGYKGVPLYVYYAPNQEAKILPQILTPDLILQTIALTK